MKSDIERTYFVASGEFASVHALARLSLLNVGCGGDAVLVLPTPRLLAFAQLLKFLELH